MFGEVSQADAFYSSHPSQVVSAILDASQRVYAPPSRRSRGLSGEEADVASHERSSERGAHAAQSRALAADKRGSWEQPATAVLCGAPIALSVSRCPSCP